MDNQGSRQEVIFDSPEEHGDFVGFQFEALDCHGNRVFPALGVFNEELNVPPVHGVSNGTPDHQASLGDQVRVHFYELCLECVHFLQNSNDVIREYYNMAIMVTSCQKWQNVPVFSATDLSSCSDLCECCPVS